jgi:hypothetical protein
MLLYTWNIQFKELHEEKMTRRALLSSMALNVHNFWVPQNFSQAHLFEVGLNKNPGTLGLKFSQPINFNYNQSISIMNYLIFLNILKNWIIHFVAPSHFTLHPNFQRLSSWTAGFSRMGHDPWEVFSTASHFKYKAGLNFTANMKKKNQAAHRGWQSEISLN